MELRKAWQAKKFQAEEAFKKAHAGELLDAHTEGTTGFPLKFNLDLGPTLDKYETAKQKKNEADAKKYLQKAKEVVGKYKHSIDGQKNQLGAAYKPLNEGITYLEQKLK